MTEKYLIWQNGSKTWLRQILFDNDPNITDDKIIAILNGKVNACTKRVSLAGRYTKEQAIEYCNRPNWEGSVPDALPVQESIALEISRKINFRKRKIK